MKDLFTNKILTAMDLIRTREEARGSSKKQSELKPLDIEDFDVLVYYRSFLVQRRHAIKGAYEASMEQIKRDESRCDELIGSEMVEFAREMVDGAKLRQFPTSSGVVSVRKLPNHLIIRNKMRLIEWAQRALPHALRRSAMLSDLTEDQMMEVQGLVEDGIIESHKVRLKEDVSLIEATSHWRKTKEVPDGTVVSADKERLHLKGDVGTDVIGTEALEADQVALPPGPSTPPTAPGDGEEGDRTEGQEAVSPDG